MRDRLISVEAVNGGDRYILNFEHRPPFVATLLGSKPERAQYIVENGRVAAMSDPMFRYFLQIVSSYGDNVKKMLNSGNTMVLAEYSVEKEWDIESETI